MTKRKKSDAQKRYRKAFLKAERLWKEILNLRDGRQCMVQKYFPTARLTHSEVIQGDHFITRGDKNLFFNPKNGTNVCSCCNMAKKNKSGPVDEMIRRIVVDREGGEEVGIMLDVHMSHQPNLNWKSADWLEEQVIPMLEEYKRRFILATD